jgi:hypothetical protein
MASSNDQGPSGQVLRLQDEVTREVNGDAQHLATAIFGKPGDMPDVARVPDDVLEARYRQAYQNQDRQWLTQEAQRDPNQFVKTARKIGVMLPEEMAKTPPPPEQAAPTPVMPPPAPVAAPAPALPLPPGLAGVPAPAPVSPVPLPMPPPVAMPAPTPPMPMAQPPVM